MTAVDILKQLIIDQIREAEDANLLDLIYKLLLTESR